MKINKPLINLTFLFMFFFVTGYTLVNSAEIKDEGYLGITISDLDESEKKISGIRHGVVITSVMDDSPAEKSGLHKFDVIQTFNNKKIEDTEDLYDIVRETKPDTKVTIVFIREGKKENTDVILGRRKTNKFLYDYTPLNRFFSFRIRSYLGIQIQELNSDLGSYFGVEEGQGVLVLSVTDDSPAQEAGIKAGDIIIQIGKEKIQDPEDVMDAVSDYDESEKVDITVIRYKKTLSLQLQVKQDYDDIHMYKWRGFKPGIHFRDFKEKWHPGSFDLNIIRERDYKPDEGKHFRRNILRLSDKQILL